MRVRRQTVRAEFRDDRYDSESSRYDSLYHGRPPSDLTPAQLRAKVNLRAWLNNQQTLRRRPQMIQGLVPKRGPEIVRRRFLQKP